MELSWSKVEQRAYTTALQISKDYNKTPLVYAYPIPSAGVHAAQAIRQHVTINLQFVENPADAEIYIDDLIDSGDTMKNIYHQFGVKPVYVLVHKNIERIKEWVSFPWDRMKNHAGPEDNIRRILQHIGEDPQREGLLETPARVVKSYDDLFSGYNYKTDEDVGKLMKCFEDGACNEMVLLKNIEFYSTCEHHMLNFAGRAHIAYLPQGKVVGLSKLARLLEVYSRRLQIQEKLTQQITQALDLHLQPLGSACILEASHSCMTCRGVMKQNSVMVTSSLTGEFLKPEVRAELLSLIKL